MLSYREINVVRMFALDHYEDWETQKRDIHRLLNPFVPSGERSIALFRLSRRWNASGKEVIATVTKYYEGVKL